MAINLKKQPPDNLKEEVSNGGHTPGELKCHLNGNMYFYIDSVETGEKVASVQWEYSPVTKEIHIANAKRIVTCWNEHDSLKAENEKVKRLLHDLTPGGSEFYNDPEYCEKWIRESREQNHDALSNVIKETKAENERLRELSEKWGKHNVELMKQNVELMQESEINMEINVALSRELAILRAQLNNIK